MKPVVLTFVRYYLPGFRSGGPIRTIANLVEQLGDEFEFRVVTQDRDHGDKNSYPEVQLDTWVPCGKGWVYYVSRDRAGFKIVDNIIRTTPHDMIYLNSFFNPLFTGSVLISRLFRRFYECPIVLAPRGEFSGGALRIRRIKKHAYIWGGRLVGLYKDIIWQASSEFEANDIKRSLGVCEFNKLPSSLKIIRKLIVAPDIASNSTAKSLSAVNDSDHCRPGNPLRVCFLSRVCEIKNLTYALEVLSRVRVSISFSIYGPTEDTMYWARCQALIAALPSNIHVEYRGVAEHSEVRQILIKQDLFFLPTLGENFGHVIVEALQAGLTLLISDKTPWRSLDQSGVGWDLPLDDPLLFTRKIEEVASWTQDDFKHNEENINRFLRNIEDDKSTLNANRRLFADAIMPKGIAAQSIDGSMG
jgi:glycosyltransferase involved in cell wall biosynthesis